ncbi:uncharacterized protein pug [Lepeophtheirus salmonis]|uniref:uncharacterized protein pug n=1 Tax=Lepeophtheirus salmonis TaxID=72036 RepID=UPI001AE1BAED|nr:formate--tetrahydrofolate ligase-like [Lepeophtheirus salmonis]
MEDNFQKQQIKKIQSLSNNYDTKELRLVIIGIGDDLTCTNNCYQYATQLGLHIDRQLFSRTISADDIIKKIELLNEDDTVYGIMILSQFEPNDNALRIINSIQSSKDVAGLSIKNIVISKSEGIKNILPPSTMASMHIIKHSGVKIERKHIAVLLTQDKQQEFEPLINNLKNMKAVITQGIVDISQSGEYFYDYVNTSDIVITNSNDLANFAIKRIKKGGLLLNFGGNSPELELLKLSYLFQNVVTTIEDYIHNILDAKWNLRILSLNTLEKVPTDSEISLSQTPKPIATLIKEIGLAPKDVMTFGKTMAKINLNVLDKFSKRENGRYIIVAGINPTPFGEGKSTTTIGLCQALGSQSKKNVIGCVRQPSQGPTFGIKGGAAGGGYSQVIPMQDFNLHLTGDIHAVTAANNLLAAQIDARMFHEMDQRERGRSNAIKGMYSRLVPGKVKKFSKVQLERLCKLGIEKTDPNDLTEDEREKFSFLNIDPSTITFNRVLDTNDRMLRKITIGQSPTEKNRQRITKFDMTVASEIMAILALAISYEDMKKRLSNMVIASDTSEKPVTAHDLGVVEGLCALLKDAIKPTLMQTLEGTPILVHTGPFANIAHGNSSILADKIALKIVGCEGYVVTEAGFGADIGLEKFFNIKSRSSKIPPNAVVIVCTIRALKMHGDPEPKIGNALTKETYTKEDENLLRKGFENLARHIENANKFGVPVVICVNQFSYDTKKELELLKELCLSSGAFDCVISNHWAKGGYGAKDLATSVIKACESKISDFKLLYPLEISIVEKISIVAKEIYRAEKIELSDEAKCQIERLEKQGYGNFPICVAKTQFSFSSDPNLKGAPKGFVFPVKSVSPSVGAGFIVVFAGTISTMPGLPVRPCFYDMHFDMDKEVVAGLF